MAACTCGHEDHEHASLAQRGGEPYACSLPLCPCVEFMGMPENEKRGPGRPPLNPDGGVTTTVRLRLSDADLEEAGRLIADGRGKNVSEVTRWLYRQSAEKRKS